jgi:hypothetical protein
MDDETKILWPHETIQVRGERITVNELRAEKTFEFLRLLADSLGKFVTVTSDGRLKGDFTIAQLKDVTVGSAELAKFLILESTGRDEAWFKDLRASEFVTVLDKALEWNLHPELLKKVEALGRHFKAALPGATAAASPRSTTSSDGKGTTASH